MNVARLGTVPRNRIVRVAMLAACVLVALGGSAFLIAHRNDLPSDAAFRVGDTVVGKAELDRRVRLLGALYGVRPPPQPERVDEYRRATAHAIAVSTILDQAEAERHIEISDKEASDALGKLIDQQMGPQGRDAYVQLLGEAGASEPDVLDEIKRQQRTQRLIGQVTSDVAGPVPDADVQAYYRDHPTEMVAPEQRHLRNIVVTSQPEADDIARRLRAGEDFAAVAGQSSADQATRGKGGDLDFQPRAQLDDAFGGAAFGAAPGALFGPVKSGNGWNVGQVLEIRPATPLAFDQVRSSLSQRLQAERVLARWRQWQDEEYRRVPVVYADEYRPADPAPPPAPLTSSFTAPAAGTGSGPSGRSVSSPVGTAIVLYGLAAAFIAVGLWGRRNLDDLVPSARSEKHRAKRRRVLRRGWIASVVGGVAFALLATLGIVASLM